MTPDKIISLIERYEEELAALGIPPRRIDPSRTFASLDREGCLAHARYLCDGAKGYASDPERIGKANRHLTAIQMCLSFAGLYTLEDLMGHNRP
jgi:hypothetical protein